MEAAEKMPLSQMVADRLKAYIIEQELKPGDRLPSSNKLIEMLNVSRTVVREALKSLESIGILRIKASGGIYVEDPTLKPFVDQVAFKWKAEKKKMQELLAVRKILELGAIDLAIVNGASDALKQMQEAIEAMKKEIAAGFVPIESDLAFHRALFKATGNQTFVDLSDVLTDFFKEMGSPESISPEEDLISLRQHQEIYEAIRQKKPRKAKMVMTLHLEALE